MKLFKWSIIAILISYCSVSSYANVISASISVIDYPNGVFIGTSLTFQATVAASSGDVLTYSWDFGDGSTPVTTDVTFSGGILSTQLNYAYSKCGLFMVKLTVIDKTPGSQGNIFTYSNPLYNITVTQPYLIDDIYIGSSCWSPGAGNIGLSSTLTTSAVTYKWVVNHPSGLPSDYILNNTSPDAILNFSTYPPTSFPYSFTVNLTISSGGNDCRDVTLSKTFTINTSNSPACGTDLCHQTNFTPGVCNNQMNGFQNFNGYITNVANWGDPPKDGLYFYASSYYDYYPNAFWQKSTNFSRDIVYSVEFDMKNIEPCRNDSQLKFYAANGLDLSQPVSSTFPSYPHNSSLIGSFLIPVCGNITTYDGSFKHYQFNFTPVDNSYDQLWIHGISSGMSGCTFKLTNISLKPSKFIDNIINVCGTFNSGSVNLYDNASKIYAGQPVCSSGTTINDNAKVNIIASDFVSIGPGFIANKGSLFAATINPHPLSEICASRYGNTMQDSMLTNELNHEETFNMYPNPSTGEISLKYKYDVEKNISIYIRNAIGTLVYTENVGMTKDLDTRINLSNLSKGIYIVTVIADGEVNSQQLSLLD